MGILLPGVAQGRQNKKISSTRVRASGIKRTSWRLYKENLRH